MEPIIVTLVLLLVHSSIAVPVVEWSSSQCSSRCLSDPQFVRFDSQKTYEYQLQTKTVLNQRQQLLLDATVEVSQHSPCDLSLQLRSVRFTGLHPTEALQLAQELESEPIQFGYDDGVVTDVCPSSEDQLWSIDVKKAIISSLQMSSRSLDARQVVMESDILGDCETVYQPMTRRYSQSVVKKTKQLNRCQNRQLSNIGLFPRSFASSYSGLPLMNATFECVQTVDKDLLSGATCRETQQLSGTEVLSELNIRFSRQFQGLNSRRVQNVLLNSNHLRMTSTMHSSHQNEDFSRVLKNVCQNLESDSSVEKTIDSFPELISVFNHNNRNQIQKARQQLQNGQICSSHQLEDLFYDASALSGTQSGAQVLLDAYQSKRVSPTRSSYLFSLLAFTSNPTEEAVETLYPLLKNSETPKHVILGISGLIHNLRQQKPNESQSQKAIDSLLQRMQNQNKDSQIVGTIKALQNIGLESHQRGRQQLIKLVQDTRQSSSVRSAAIKVLAEAMDSRQRQEMLEVFKRENESNEIRINAYKAVVMSGADQNQLQLIKDQIQREQNRDIQQFVRSHQKNLRETSDPHKKYVLPTNAPQFENPSNQMIGVSNNFEGSFMIDAISVGIAAEADVIHVKDSTIPRSITANLTVPAFGRELQLIEVEIRQKGFEQIIQQKMRHLKNKSGQSLIKQLMSDAIEIISSVDQFSNSVGSRDIQMQMYVKVDGKTILSVDASDAKADWEQLWNKLRQKLDQRLDIDRAFAVQPINTRIQLPSTNGLPIVVRLNATLVSSFKASIKVSDFNKNTNSKVIESQLSPSLAFQVEAGVEFNLKSHKKSVEIVSRVSSSPVWDSKAEIKENRIANFKINLPKERQSVVRVQSQVYERDSNGVRKAVKTSSWLQSRSYDQKWCTKSLNRPFGIQFCAEMTSQPMAYELTVEKSDRTMKSIELSFESPQKDSSSELQNYRISFNTPNSEVDRELTAELQLQNQGSQRKLAKMEIRSPWIRYSVEAGLRNEEKEQSLQLDVQKDGRKAFSIDVGLESQQRGQKREYRPRVRIQLSPQSEAIQMQGSVSVSKGRKNQLQIQLEGNQKQFLKGSFVREGERKSNDIRVSTDLSANFPGIEVRVTGVAEKGIKHAETDLTIEYRIRQQRKESLKISAKVQNLTQSQLTKVSAFSELTSTQYPSANFHLAYNLLSKPKQQMENELTLAWTQQLKSKIHVLHVTKLSEPSSNHQKLENTINVEITPLNVNYELRANGEAVRSQSGSSGPKYSAEVIGKDRTGNKDNDMKATFEYEHVSRAPLHLTLEANLKTKNRDMQYKDELKERSEGEYQGQTSFQWNKGKKADLDYNYKIKGELHHEMDAQLKTGEHTFKHQGLLKMSRQEFQLKSKLSSNESPVYSVDSYLSRESPSRVEAQTVGYAFKASADPYSVPHLASVEVWTPNARFSPFSHKTNVEYIPRTSFAMKSDTKRNNKQLVNIDAHISRTTPSRLVWNSEPIEGRFDCDLISDKRSANLNLKSLNNDWSHSSSMSVEPQQYEYELKSKTVSKGKPLINIESNWKGRTGQNSFLNIEIPQKKSSLSLDFLNGRQQQRNGKLELLFDDVKHNTNFEWNPRNSKISSKTDRNRRQIHSLDYSSVNGIHSLDSELLNNYKMSGEVQPFGEEPYLNFGAQSKSHQFETQNKISKQNNKIQFESKTKQKGQKLYDLNALVSPSFGQESRMSFSSPQIRSNFQTTPYSSAQFEYESPEYSHSSSGKWVKNDYSLDSKSVLKQKQNQFLNIDFKHSLKMSRISAKSQPLEAYLELENQQKGKFGFQSNYRRYPLNHMTEVSLNGKQLNIESRTDSQSDNLFSVNSELNGIENRLPSSLRFKVGNDFTAKARVQPFGGEKQITFEAKHPKFSHSSVLDLNDNSLSLKSRTDDISGRPLAKIDAFLTPDEEVRSHLNFVSRKMNSNLEYEPKKSAKFELNVIPFEHKTEFNRNQNQFRIQSKTTKQGINLLDFDSHLNPTQRMGKLQIQTGLGWDHSSEVSLPLSHRSLALNSETSYNKRLLNRINFNLNANDDNNHEIEFEIPQLKTKSGLNLNEKSLLFDLKSKFENNLKNRHILASIQFNKGFHSDIAWDLLKDQNQRLKIDFNNSQDNSHEGVASLWGEKKRVNQLSVNYAGNQVNLVTRMTSSRPLSGPHEIQLDFIPKFNEKRDSLSLLLKHEINNNQKEMNCFLEFKESNESRFLARVNSKLEQTGLTVQIETKAPRNPDLEMKISFIEKHLSLWQKNGNIFAELKALKTALNQEFLFSTKIQRKDNEFTGFAKLETPSTYGLKEELEFIAKQNQLKVWTNGKSGKQLELNANYEIENQKSEANLELKSNIRGIPSITASGVFSGEKIEFIVESEQKRQIDFSLQKSGFSMSSGFDVSGRLETPYSPKIETKNTFKWNPNELEIQSNIKYNFKDLLNIQLEARRRDRVWNGNAKIVLNEKELAKASIDSSFGFNNAFNYVFEAKTNRFSPIKIQFSAENVSSLERKVSINACSGPQQQCVDIKSQWKMSSSHPMIPSNVLFSLSKMGTNFEFKTSFNEEMSTENSETSLLGLTLNQRPKEKIRNQFLVTINSHSFGFDSILTKRRDSYDWNSRIHFPSEKIIQMKTDFKRNNNNNGFISKTQLIVDQNEPILETLFEFQSNSDSSFGKIQFNSSEFRSKKSVSFEMRKSFFKIDLNLTKDPNNALTIETQLNSQTNNKTIVFNVFTKNKRKIDFQLKTHLSRETFGLELENLNRNGIKKFVHLLVRREPMSSQSSTGQRYSARIQTNENRYSIEANSNRNGIQFKVLNEKNGKQNDIKIISDKNCLKMQIDSKESLDFCFNNQNSNQISSFSFENNSQKQFEVSLDLNENDRKSLQFNVNWNTNYLNQIKKNSFQTSNQFNRDFNEFLGEFYEEFNEKIQLISEQMIIPFVSLISDQFSDVIQELYQTLKSFQLVQNIQQYFEGVVSFFNRSVDWLKERVGNSLNNWLVVVRRQCKQSEMCFKTIYEKNGFFNTFSDIFAEKSLEMFKRSQRLVMKTNGVLNQWIPSYISDNWLQYYRQSFSNFLDTILSSNEDLRLIFNHFQTIFTELTKNSEQIDWNSVKKSFKQMSEIVFSSQSSSRVVVWDPKRGKASFEIRSPVVDNSRVRTLFQDYKQSNMRSMFH